MCVCVCWWVCGSDVGVWGVGVCVWSLVFRLEPVLGVWGVCACVCGVCVVCVCGVCVCVWPMSISLEPL